MEQLTPKELERVLSLYIDGELDPIESKKLQDYISSHPSVERDLKILQTAKKAVTQKRSLPVNEWFWLKLSNNIESKRVRRRHFLLSSSTASLVYVTALIVIVIGGIYFKDSVFFHKFFQEKKSQIQSSLLTGNILPLFTNLTNDDVLNFALFGSLPLDSSKETELQVTTGDNKRSQFEIIKTTDQPASKNISVNEFCESVGITENQQEIVDSILGTYRRKLQTTAFVSENKEIAIHEELAQMNRAVISTIVSSLEPLQKVKFQKYLTAVNAPYAVIAVNAPAVEPKTLFDRIPNAPRTNRYVIVSKDTIGIAEMKMNMDSIRDVVRKHEFIYQRTAAQRMLKDLAEIQRGVEPNFSVSGSTSNPVRLHATNNAFQINFESAPYPNNFEMVENIHPKIRSSYPPVPGTQEFEMLGDSAFVMEMHADKNTMKVLKRLPSGEFRLEFIDSLQHSPRMKVLFRSNKNRGTVERTLKHPDRHQEKLIDLDSLLNESKKKDDAKVIPPSKNSKLFEM